MASDGNIVFTAVKSSSVTHSASGHFSSPEAKDLIVAKCTRIEIYTFQDTCQLELLAEVPIYGRVACLRLFRRSGDNLDSLLLVTAKFKLHIMQWDTAASKIHTRSVTDLSDHMCRSIERDLIGIIDPECRIIGLHMYDGLFKVINIKDGLQADFRLKEDHVLDMKFLHGCDTPTVAILHQDGNGSRHIRTYKVLEKKEDLVDGPLLLNNLHLPSFIIPVPMPLGGVIIVGEEMISFHSAMGSSSIMITPSITRAYDTAGTDGFEYMLCNHAGVLTSLRICIDGESTFNLVYNYLGVTSIASTVSCIKNNYVFIGSSYGDSQLILIDKSVDLKVHHTFENLGPITDFCVVDLGRRGQGQQLVTCSGAYKDGSLRIVSKFFHIIEEASAEPIVGMKGMWPLRLSLDEVFDSLLVVSCTDATYVFERDLSGALTSTENAGFDLESTTLFCHEAVHKQWVQVTKCAVRLVNSETRELRYEWNNEINVATSNTSQILVACGTALFYLKIGDGTCTHRKADLENEVSCLGISTSVDNANYGRFVAVGQWITNTVLVISLSEMEVICRENLDDALPRSVLFCAFEKVSYLLCGCGEGELFSFHWDTSTRSLSDKKTISLGTQPVNLRTFVFNKKPCVFVQSDESAVIYGSKEHQLLYWMVNFKVVNYMCTFNHAAFPDRYLLSDDNKLITGTHSDTLHIRTIPLGEHARCICHQEQSQTFALCAYCQTTAEESHFVRLLRDKDFSIVSSFKLDENECGCCIISCSFTGDNKAYYCVGTSYVIELSKEPTKGRLLVFTVDDGALKLITEKETHGAVYSLDSFRGKLLAAVKEEIQLYNLAICRDGSQILELECRRGGLVQALHVKTKGDLIVVGDFMKSMFLFRYNEAKGTIEEHARSYNSSNCMTAVDVLSPDVYLGAEQRFNLMTVRRNESGEPPCLDVVGNYHVGEYINQFRHGSFSPTSTTLPVIFGTVSGTIGLIFPIEDAAAYNALALVQQLILDDVRDSSHREWRSSSDDTETEINSQNFIDGDLVGSCLNLSQDQRERIATEIGKIYLASIINKSIEKFRSCF